MLSVFRRISSLNSEYFIFVFSLLFYFLLYFSGNNKVFLGIFLLFGLIFWGKFKNLSLCLFLLYLLSLPFGKGKTFEFTLIPAWFLKTDFPYTYAWTITASDLFFILLLVLILKEEVKKLWSGGFLKPAKRDIFLFLFLFFVFLSTFFSSFPLVSFLAFLKILRWAAVYFLIRQYISWPQVKKFLPLILAAALIFEGAWASLQFVFQRSLNRSIEATGSLFSPYGQMATEEKTFFRSQGTFEHANTLGTFLVISMIFIFLQIFTNGTPANSKKIYGLALGLGLLALIFSASRAGWLIFFLMAIASLLFLGRKHKFKWQNLYQSSFLKFYLLGFLAFITLLLTFIFPRLSHFYQTFSGEGGAFYRTYLLEKAWLISQDAPLGIGLASFPAVLMQKFGFFAWPTPVHNLLAEVLVETGIISLIFFVIFLVSAYRDYWQNLTRIKLPLDFSLKSGAFFASLSFLAASMVYPFFTSSGMFEYFWFFLGIMLY